MELEHQLAMEAVEEMTPHEKEKEDAHAKEKYTMYHISAGSVKCCHSEVFPSRDSALYDTTKVAKAMVRPPSHIRNGGDVGKSRNLHIKTKNPIHQTVDLDDDLDVVGGNETGPVAVVAAAAAVAAVAAAGVEEEEGVGGAGGDNDDVGCE